MSDAWATCMEAGLASLALHLEPTDAVVLASTNTEISIARGGASNFPLYWNAVEGSMRISTALPIDHERNLSIAGLLASITVVSVTSQNEPNLLPCTPVAGWYRCRRGAVSNLSSDGGLRSEQPIDHSYICNTDLSRDPLLNSIRFALDKYGQRQASSSSALVELSGGFDSTLAAIAARSYGVELMGVSLQFPYYEFRFEENIQREVAESLEVPRTILDGTELFAYAPPNWWPRLDEPATAIIGLKRDIAISQLASNNGISRLLVGHGGDQLFSENILRPMDAPCKLARGAFNRAAWRQIEHDRILMKRGSSILSRSTLTYLHDARLDVALKEAYGTITRSPFTELEMAKCGIAWAALSTQLGSNPDKSILADAFDEDLPCAVVTRPGKVSWDGVCARAYAKHSDALLGEIDRVAGPLDHIGINVGWIVKRISELAQWKRTAIGEDDKEVFAVYALATWLQSWGVERVSDCRWSN